LLRSGSAQYRQYNQDVLTVVPSLITFRKCPSVSVTGGFPSGIFVSDPLSGKGVTHLVDQRFGQALFERLTSRSFGSHDELLAVS
jgi:hypothetical protein